MSEFSIKVTGGKAAVFTPYNRDFVEKIKLIGARWDASGRCWTIVEDAIPDARAAMRAVYGRDDTPVAETVDVELSFGEPVYGDREPVSILGRSIASAYGRDSGARVGEGVVFLSGKPKSGGSAKNWRTIIPDGCVVKVLKLPKSVADAAALPDGVTMRILCADVDRAVLEDERATLLSRIAEIDDLLSRHSLT